MNRLSQLKELCKKYPSDIDGHGYLEVFAEHFPEKCRSMLEIGIAKGDSALIWDALYGSEELDLHYLDLFVNPEFVSARWCRNRGFVPHIGSQASMAVLSSIRDQFELAVDDGSHVAAHMIISFKHLFINNLQPNGKYFITDTHCNFDPFYWGEGVESLEDTPIKIFERYIQSGKIESKFFSEGESEVFQSLIDDVQILCDNKIIMIKKKP